MTIFSPTNALVSVDLPAFGLPTRQAKPERKASPGAVTRESVISMTVLRNDPTRASTKGLFDGCAVKRTPSRAASVGIARAAPHEWRLSQLAHLEDVALNIHRPDRDARAR